MVRGPAALLGTFALAQVYFEVAGSLPALADADATAIASAAVATALLAVLAFALLALRDEPLALAPIALGTSLIAGALTAADVGASANPAKVMFAAALGLLFAWFFEHPAIVVAVPLLVAGVDVYSVAQGPSHLLIASRTPALDYITLQIPGWGGGSGQLGLSDVFFMSLFAAAAWRHGLRRRATLVGLVAGLLAAIVIAVLTRHELAALPGLALGLLLPNIDRLPALLADERAG